MPMPKATVATTTSHFSAANASCVAAAVVGGHARRGTARPCSPPCCSAAASVVHVLAAQAVDDARLARVPVEHLAHLARAGRAAAARGRSGSGRSKLPTSTSGSRRPSCSTMSRADLLGGGRGVGVDGGVGEELAEPAELPVLGAEVVAPVADAVGLVDGDGVRRRRRAGARYTSVLTSRSGETNTQPRSSPRADRLGRGGALVGGQRAVEPHGRDADARAGRPPGPSSAR